ncbi:MAG: tRNA (adenosine(37)-N6)-threonylcarbamoyltransferase complex dimerization subunit type 1 TsaB [Hyphomicrobiales bacterium]|nr:tRNA (adenosine(37)-N6)-threonylcarbamoyltransferase complex dimerization subunit type 1 TsaB [Hyphomicrobiales bacterium]
MSESDHEAGDIRHAYSRLDKATAPTMHLLAIDTTCERCSVGLDRTGAPPILLSETIGRGHAEKLLPMVADVMGAAPLSFGELGRIAVTTGPGSFTGLRVGIAAARGLALVLGCSLVGVGTLDALAERARILTGPRPVLATLAARRAEVYYQLFDRLGVPMTDPRIGPATDVVPLVTADTVVAGSGAASVIAEAGATSPVAHADTAPEIGAVMRLARTAPVPPEAPAPLYLRPPDAKPQGAATLAG